MNELWLTEVAAEFWEKVGGYKRDFELAALVALPWSIERLPGLSLKTAHSWLSARGFSPNLTRLASGPDRALRGCLVAFGEPHNFVLLDELDTPAEQLFSLAHEAAHFLLDYLHPRRHTTQKLSPALEEVLDGERRPTTAERLQAVLSGVSLQPHYHFMERNSAGDILSGRVRQAESRADQLALELLAPLELALPMVKAATKGQPGYAARLEAARKVVIEEFGLPKTIAKDYARHLVEQAGGQESFMEWLNS